MLLSGSFPGYSQLRNLRSVMNVLSLSHRCNIPVVFWKPVCYSMSKDEEKNWMEYIPAEIYLSDLSSGRLILKYSKETLGNKFISTSKIYQDAYINTGQYDQATKRAVGVYLQVVITQHTMSIPVDLTPIFLFTNCLHSEHLSCKSKVE